MKALKNIATRVGVCSFFVAPMWYLWMTGSRFGAIIGLVAALVLYLGIQALTEFRHPLHGALLVVVLALAYLLLAPASGTIRKRHAMSDRELNDSCQPTPGRCFSAVWLPSTRRGCTVR